MAAPITTMTPDRDKQARELAAAGVPKLHAARQMGIAVETLAKWAKRNGVTFADGRSGGRSPAQMEVSRATILRANAASAAKRRLPLNAEERRDYQRFWVKAAWMGIPITRDDAFRAIGRPDLVGAS